jgi:hypothetical protein
MGDMKHTNILLFVIVCFLSGAGTVLGSVLGSRLANALFVGAIVGGILGILAASWLATRLGLIERSHFVAAAAGAMIGFALAGAVAVTNLHTPLIPLASITLVGLGAVAGNRYLSGAKALKPEFAFAILGAGLSAPALVFVTTALLKYGLGFAQPFDLLDKLFASPDRLRILNLISPLVFLGGLLAALAINLYPQINLRIRRDNSRLVATVIAEAKPINLAVVVLCGLLLAILAGYVALENFPGL